MAQRRVDWLLQLLVESHCQRLLVRDSMAMRHSRSQIVLEMAVNDLGHIQVALTALSFKILTDLSTYVVIEMLRAERASPVACMKVLLLCKLAYRISFTHIVCQ